MIPHRWALALVLGLAANATHLHGQTTGPDTTQQQTGARSGAKVYPVGGIRYGAPLGASLYGGVILARDNPAGFAGPALAAEVGQDGARASLGVSSVTLAGTHRAYLSVIRTWDDHGDVRSGQVYVGPEVAVGLFLGITLGYYWRISDGGGPARLVSIGSVIGT